MSHKTGGKVRNVYPIGNERLLIQTSDRVSAFDQILTPECPGKGALLNKISSLWFQKMECVDFPRQHGFISHFISSSSENFPVKFQSTAFAENSMLVHRARSIPVECIVRGYLTPSFLPLYKQFHADYALPATLQSYDKLPYPIFTPTTKEMKDRYLSMAQASERFGATLMRSLQEISLQLFQFGANLLQQNGIILVDTKFEFGWIEQKLCLIDEVFTPDSSRFLLFSPNQLAKIKEKGAKESDTLRHYDKQFLRNYMLSQCEKNKTYPKNIPIHILHELLRRYQSIEKIVEKQFST